MIDILLKPADVSVEGGFVTPFIWKL